MNIKLYNKLNKNRLFGFTIVLWRKISKVLMSKLTITTMKQEYKTLSTFICFLLVFSSIYFVKRINEGPIAGLDGLFRVASGSDMDIETGRVHVKNRPTQPGVSENVQVQNRPTQPEMPEHVQVLNRHGQSQPDAYDVILSAYKHGGSSITGRVLGNRGDAFYIYEPLWKLLRASFYKGPDLRCLDSEKYCLNLTQELSSKTDHMGVERNKTSHLGGSFMKEYTHGINRMLNATLDYLKSIFECSFRQYSQYFNDPRTNMLLDGPHAMVYFKGEQWDPFKSCIKRSAEPYDSCWKEAETMCRTAKHRVINCSECHSITQRLYC